MRLIDADKFADTLKEIAESKWCKPEYTEAFYVVGNLLVGRDKEKYSPTVSITMTIIIEYYSGVERVIVNATNVIIRNGWIGWEANDINESVYVTDVMSIQFK